MVRNRCLAISCPSLMSHDDTTVEVNGSEICEYLSSRIVNLKLKASYVSHSIGAILTVTVTVMFKRFIASSLT